MNKLIFFNKLMDKLSKAKIGEVVTFFIAKKQYYIKKIKHDRIRLLKKDSPEINQ